MHYKKLNREIRKWLELRHLGELSNKLKRCYLKVLCLAHLASKIWMNLVTHKIQGLLKVDVIFFFFEGIRQDLSNL